MDRPNARRQHRANDRRRRDGHDQGPGQRRRDRSPDRPLVARRGDAPGADHRSEGGTWTVDATDVRNDLPSALELLLTTQTGGESDHGDLIASFDWLHVVGSPVGGDLAVALDGNHSVDAAALLSQLGD